VAANSSAGSVKVNTALCSKDSSLHRNLCESIRPVKKVCVEMTSVKFTQMGLVFNKTRNVGIT
jgi:hypothetical protein